MTNDRRKTTDTPGSGWRQGWLLALLLVAAVVLAYQPAWKAGFVWDDDDYVTQNPLLTAPDGLWRIWFSTDSPSQYFPLVYTTLRLEHALWGLNASGYHWVNILLHAMNALLAWRLLGRLAVPGAWLGAAIFALHPVQVESVAWITELKNVQSLFFFLLALLAWVKFTEREAQPEWRWYAAAIVCHALALFSKTTACTLPAALVLTLWLRHQPVNRTRWFQVIPFLVLGLGMGLVTVWWERTQQGTQGESFSLGAMDRLLIASRAVWFYLGKLLWPADLAFSYPRWEIDRADPLAYGWLLAGGVLAAAVYYARRFAGRGVEVTGAFYLAMLSPLLGVVMLYTFRYSFVADHYQYVALLGPAALASAGIVRLLRPAGPGAAILLPVCGGVLVVLLGTLSWRQSRMYTDLETLWATTIARNPGSFIARANLSATLIEQGRIDEALPHAQAALALEPEGPDHALARINLGNALLQKGRIDEATGHFRAAVGALPDSADARNNLGFALFRTGRLDEAVAQLEQALKLEPGHANAHYNLAHAWVERGRPDIAAEHYRQALTGGPADAETHNDLGTALLLADRSEAAAIHFEQALARRPDLAEAHANLAFLRLRAGRAREALDHYQAALRVQPDNVRTLSGLAWLLATCADATIRDGARAVELAQQARALSDGEDVVTLHALAAAYAEGGRFDEAVAVARRALQLAGSHAPALVEMLGVQLKCYETGAPFRESAAVPPS